MISRQRGSFLAALLVTGASGFVAQLLFLRELVVVFSGNELSIGIILGNCLLAESLGSFIIAKLASRIRDKAALFVALQTAFSAFFISALFAARSLKWAIGVHQGVALGPAAIMLGAFFVVSGVMLTHGASFACACLLGPSDLPAIGRRAREVIPAVYSLEMIGTILGGLCFIYLLIPAAHSFWIWFWVASLNLASGAYVLYARPDKTRFSRAQFSSVILSLAALLILAPMGILDRLNDLSLKIQWRGQKIIHYENSVHGNVVLASSAGQYTVFFNGTPGLEFPNPNTESLQESANLPMLFLSKPMNVLVIGNGAGGLIDEILGHRVNRVDYLELDPLMIRLALRLPAQAADKALSDKRVRLIFMDGRYFLETTDCRYDLILLGLKDPSDLETNRYFTREFFLLSKSRLAPGGVLTLSMPGSLSYMSGRLRDLNGCIFATVKSVFSYVRVIPGEENIYLASSDKGLTDITPDAIALRAKDRAIDSPLLTKEYLDYRLNSSYQKWFYDSIRTSSAGLNEDLRPRAVLITLLYRMSAYPIATLHTLKSLFISSHMSAVFLAILSVLIITLILGIKRRPGLAAVICVASTGFAAMIFELLLIFGFQMIYGYAYYQMALLITLFMAGSVAGGIYAGAVTGERRIVSGLLAADASIIIFAFLIGLGFVWSSHSIRGIVASGAARAAFGVASIAAGLFCGIEFPLAGKLAGSRKGNTGNSAGYLYGWDMAGGWLGGILGGVFLLPALGLTGACLVVIVIKVISLAGIVMLRGSLKE